MKTIPTKRRLFPNWESFMAEATKPAVTGFAASITGTFEFARTHTHSEAVELATKGWRDGVAKIDTQYAAVKAAFNDGGMTISPLYAESGDEVEVGRFLEGDPECMVEYVLTPDNKPVIKLVVSIAYSSGVNADAIFRRGAVVMLVVDALEAAGRRVEVVADWSNREDNRFVEQVVIKQADQALDRDRVAFALCHPSMLRRLMFRLHESVSETEWGKRGGSGYGMPMDPEPEDGAFVFECLRYGSSYGSPEDAARRAHEIVDQLIKS